MIIIDTNVISELWKISPDPNVLRWVDAQLVETLHLSAVTVAELRFGLATMTPGKRRSACQQRLEDEILSIMAGRILPFDLAASKAYADLMAQARARGRAIGKEDGYIAATAVVHGMAVATRDTSPFQAAGVVTINPWEPVTPRSP